TGMVVDTDGKPAGGMYIMTRPAGERGIQRALDCMSTDTGAFACDPLPAGDYRVSAEATRLPRPGPPDDKAGETGTVRPGQGSTVKLALAAGAGAIRGTVVDGDGKPVGDAFVSAARESDLPGGPARAILETRFSLDAHPELTAADGSFTLSRLAPGT